MRRLAFLVILLLSRIPGTAVHAAEAADTCLEAAAAAEQKWNIPPRLMAAIGRVESGRPNEASRRQVPWPWTVNANGTGSYFATREDAIAFVRILQAKGVRRIDVGCFQIDLFYHPAAFARLEDAFDPRLNADYAGRFLQQLHAQTGDWSASVARYHSALPLTGASYGSRVLAEWQSAPILHDAYSERKISTQAHLAPSADRFVVMMSATARSIHVFRPSEYD